MTIDTVDQKESLASDGDDIVEKVLKGSSQEPFLLPWLDAPHPRTRNPHYGEDDKCIRFIISEKWWMEQERQRSEGGYVDDQEDIFARICVDQYRKWQGDKSMAKVASAAVEDLILCPPCMLPEIFFVRVLDMELVELVGWLPTLSARKLF